MTRWIRKLMLLAGRGRFRNELDEEMAFHRAQAVKDLVDGGMKPEAARYAAARQLGNTTRLREQSEEVVGFAWRQCGRTYGLQPAVAQESGLRCDGSADFGAGHGSERGHVRICRRALIQPLPYTQPNRLLSVDESAALNPRSNLSYATIRIGSG